MTANPTQRLTADKRRQSYSSLRLISSPRDAPDIEGDGGFEYKQRDFVPIKLGSALFSKLERRYWESHGVDGVPIIFAIETFHDSDSLYYSSSPLGTYLYGFRHEQLRNPEGKLLIVPRKVETHTFGGKTIPSGFSFRQVLSTSVLFSSVTAVPSINSTAWDSRGRISTLE